MKLYVVRHGQTDWNVQNKVCGITDVELTEEGKAQAEKVADTLSGNHIDLILSSPLKRAMQTAEIISRKCGTDLQVESRLTEQNYGIYEGVDRANERFLQNKRQFAFRYPGGESMMQVAYRIYGLLDRLKETYSEKNILLVTHGGVCRVIKTYFEDMTNDAFFRYSPPNVGLEIYEI